MHISAVVALLLVSVANAEERILQVQHRIIHPNLPTTAWSELGTVVLPLTQNISPLGFRATLVPSDTLFDDLAEFTESVDPTREGAMYQVALELPGVADNVWPTSVAKAVSRVNL
jgi:ER membrane protein complex subunit 10